MPDSNVVHYARISGARCTCTGIITVYIYTCVYKTCMGWIVGGRVESNAVKCSVNSRIRGETILPVMLTRSLSLL